MFCKKCGASVDESTNFCPKCGTNIQEQEPNREESKPTTPPSTPAPDLPSKNKTNSKKGCLGCLGFIVALFIILTAIGAFSENDKNKSTPATPASSTSSTAPKENKPPKVENWQYSQKEDTIHNNAKIKFAKTTSTNTLDFKFPYAGSQHATLLIRKNYDGSKDAMVMVEKGQFLTSMLGGKALVRFDDNSPEEFQLLPAEDNSTTVVFFKYADYFIKNVAKSKKVYIQTAFFQEGSPTMEFNIEGLSEL